ncbi:MAG: hypothetical protein K6F76_04075 [Clostridiales bacterium]|nr:hypothetical protein [Clostridiales bacterium]
MEDKYNIPSRQIISKKQKRIIAVVTAAIILAIAVIIPVAAGAKKYFEEESSIKYYFNNDGSFKLAQGLYSRGKINNESDALMSLSAIKDVAFDDGYENNLTFVARNDVSQYIAYYFKQTYYGIDVENGYVIVTADKSDTPLSCCSSYVNYLEKYVEKGDIERYRNNISIDNSMLYPYTRDDIVVQAKIVPESAKLIIYKDANGAPALGKYAEITLTLNKKKKYYAVFDAKTDALVKVGSIYNKQTGNMFIDLGVSALGNSSSALSVKQSYYDVWNCYLNDNWQSTVSKDEDISQYIVKYDNFNNGVDEIKGLTFNNDDKKSVQLNDETNSSYNSLILSHIFYNTYVYAFNESFDNLEQAMAVSTFYLCGDATYEDCLFAMIRACETLGLQESTIHYIQQCFRECGVEDNSILIFKTNYTEPPKIHLPQNTKVTKRGISSPEAKELIDALNAELKYYTTHYNTEKTSVFLEDLSHDGIPEMIVVNYENYKSRHILYAKVYMVIKNKVKEIYQTEALETRTGYNSLLIYKQNGYSYLYGYNPVKWLNTGTYSHKIFYFDEKGKTVLLDKGSIQFGEGLKNAADDKKVKKYINLNQDYIKSSALCINTYPKSDFYDLDIADTRKKAIKNETTCDGYAKNNYKDEFNRWSHGIIKD